MSKVPAGTWVEIYQEILPPGERAPQVPEDTQQVPLEMKVKGFLCADAEIGDEVEIETFTGRKLKGELIDSDPSYEHKFGRPVPELLKAAKQVKAMLKEEGGEQ